MSIPVRQSTAFEVAIGPVLDADGVAVTDCVVADFKIKKTTGNYAALNASATLTHVSAGKYDLVLTTSDVDTVGLATVSIDDTVNACASLYLQVIEEAVYDRDYAASATGIVGTAQTGDSFAIVNSGTHGNAALKTLIDAITAIFTGITSLAQWLGIIAGKQTGNSTARTELRATGAGSGTYDETTDSQEAIRDRGDSAWATATGFSTLDEAGVRTALGMAAADLDDQLAALPTAAENADAVWDEVIDTSAHNGADSAGQKLRRASSKFLAEGTVDPTGATTTSFRTDLTEDDDHWNDALLTFISGALTGQSRTILDYENVNGLITLDEALTGIPAGGVKFIIESTHIHPVTQIQSGLALASVCTEARLAELDAANLPTDVAAVKTDTAAILLDTGTDGVVVAAGSKSGYALSATGLDLIVPADPSAIPVLGTSSIVVWNGWFAAHSVNKWISDATDARLRNSADNADLATFAHSDSGTEFTSGEPT